MKQIIKDSKIIIIVAGILIAIVFSILGHSAPALKFFWRIESTTPPLQLEQEAGCKAIELDPKVDSNKYNFVSSLDFVTVKPADETLLISKDQQKRMFSLGKFKLPLETYTLLSIPKLWLYFNSDALSDRDDKLYGLEDSYLSKIIIKAGNQSQEVSLGKSGEHMFIELDDCPLGNIYPVGHETEANFEILLEIGCSNFKDGVCLDNGGEPLDYLNGADLTAIIRLFAKSYQNFTQDISIPLHSASSSVSENFVNFILL